MTDLSNINILDWHCERFLGYIPVHFTVVTLDDNGDREALLNWLDEHTTGRIGIEKDRNLEDKSTFVVVHDNLKIGFENPEEATMYSLFYK